MGQIVLFIDVKFLKSTPHIFSELKIKLDSDIIWTELTLACTVTETALKKSLAPEPCLRPPKPDHAFTYSRNSSAYMDLTSGVSPTTYSGTERVGPSLLLWFLVQKLTRLTKIEAMWFEVITGVLSSLLLDTYHQSLLSTYARLIVCVTT